MITLLIAIGALLVLGMFIGIFLALAFYVYHRDNKARTPDPVRRNTPRPHIGDP
ncbi:MAG: hypothetical protein KDK30_02500 [Leptospiraceae bacterium]|nr:hypothetical protein [Leptospiraceae bacterium]MCB1316902.1 hypothetical protein [Leptospiraceae bacterium]MCB1321161.1 hypothetical protein [Leptospiraceae bacterium]